MSDIVIKTENLGKKYTIGHQAQNGQCTLCTNVPLYDFVVKIGEMFTFADLSYEVLEIEGHHVKVATPECLLRMKEGTIRPIDQNDAMFLREFIRRKG